jgi:hypothetical protein
MSLSLARPGAAAVPCTLAVALLLFGGRWGSYIGVSPLFLTDILIAAAAAHYVLSHARTKRMPGSTPASAGVAVLWLLLIWTTVRFVAGWRLDVVAARDAAPYFYVTVGLLAAYSSRSVGPETRDRTVRILTWALGLHAAWCAFTLVLPGVADRMPVIAPSVGLRVFSFRSDFDTAMLGLWAAMLLLRIMSGAQIRLPAAAYVATWGVIFLSGSRAGVLSAIVVNGLAYVAAARSHETNTERKRSAAVIIPLIFAIALLALPQTTIGQRFAGTFGLAESENAVSALGTASARENAWSALFQYVNDTPERQLFGVGFGPNVLEDSGAGVALIGATALQEETAPRSPHNYWLGTYGRLGLIGIGLSLALVAVLTRRAWMQISRPLRPDRLALLAALLGLSMIPVASLGVVLESPFGAVPYFWSIGVLLGWQGLNVTRRRRRTVESSA